MQTFNSVIVEGLSGANYPPLYGCWSVRVQLGDCEVKISRADNDIIEIKAMNCSVVPEKQEKERATVLSLKVA